MATTRLEQLARVALVSVGATQLVVGFWPTLISAAIVAITAPLMAWWMWPLVVAVFIGGEMLGHGAHGALVALGVGVTVQTYRRCGRRPALILVAAELAGLLLHNHRFRFFKNTFTQRLLVWQESVRHWSFFGHGLGAWQRDADRWRLPGVTEPWPVACNEWIQWLYEAGVVGVALLLLACWSVRGLLADPTWGGAVAALVVTTLYAPTFHALPLAAVASVVLAVSLARWGQRPEVA